MESRIVRRNVNTPEGIRVDVIKESSGSLLFSSRKTVATMEEADTIWREFVECAEMNIENHGGEFREKTDDSFVMSMEYNKTAIIELAMMYDKQKDEFGVALFVDNKLFKLPDEWQETQVEAVRYFKDNKDNYVGYLKAAGFDTVELNVPEGMEEEIASEEEAGKQHRGKSIMDIDPSLN